MEIISRTDAKKQGLKYYFTGRPCGRGHVAKRLISNYSCVECTNKQNREWRAKNAEKARESCRIWYQKNPEKGIACSRAWQLKNKERVAKNKKEYAAKNKEKLAKLRKEYRAKNRDQIKASYQSWYDRHGKKYKRRWEREKRRTDPEHRIRNALRSRLREALQGDYKTGAAVKNLGCSIADLKSHLEAQLSPGMSWENWGREGWHIDHIIPLASFNLTDREQLKEACNYQNLRPLWAADNLSKGAKHPHD